MIAAAPQPALPHPAAPRPAPTASGQLPPGPCRQERRLPGVSELQSAVVEAVTYGDVFDWAMTSREIWRYLPIEAAVEDVEQALGDPMLSRYVEAREGLVTLRGRTELIGIRGRRSAAAAALWPRAIRYGRLVARLPFVRLVAVTGSLSVDAADSDADVDLFVVTEDGRLWLTRLMTMAVVRGASVEHLRLCPNYLMAESELAIQERSLFTAHELAQMVPVTASPAYDELLHQNAWAGEFLPNAGPREPATSDGPGDGAQLRRLAEAPLRSRLGSALERWEMDRKVRMLSTSSSSAETRYDAAVCKGHTEAHGRRALAAYEARMRSLGAV